MNIIRVSKNAATSNDQNLKQRFALLGELLFHQPMQMLSYRGMIEAADDFIEKAGD